MAYDTYLGERISHILNDLRSPFETRKMMGGLIFMVDNKILCGIHIDKKIGDSLFMGRIGEEAYNNEIEKEECLPMDFTGRPMRGYIFVKPEGFDMDEDLEYWVKLCLGFNPLAKASPKKRK